ncbi:MAG: hypothetical protein DLM73_00560 [Chthoniobacterales bacterium]|nr:MAG: hypothetical protein DLM73_00560 [Chthoniobacterales bacterium]
MRDAILASVETRRITTFQHLGADIPGFYGSLATFSPIRDSLIIWHACSREAIEELGDLIGNGSIRMHPAPNVSYRHTSDLPPIPICRDYDDFKSETAVLRWFPVVFTNPSVKNVDPAKIVR